MFRINDNLGKGGHIRCKKVYYILQRNKYNDDGNDHDNDIDIDNDNDNDNESNKTN